MYPGFRTWSNSKFVTLRKINTFDQRCFSPEQCCRIPFIFNQKVSKRRSMPERCTCDSKFLTFVFAFFDLVILNVLKSSDERIEQFEVSTVDKQPIRKGMRVLYV